MKAKTKYNLGEKVWYMAHNRPQCGNIRYIYIRVNDACQYTVTYLVHEGMTEFTEDMLYSSKQELLKTL